MDIVDRNGGLRIDAEDLQEVVALCDAGGIIVSWNKAGEEVTGFPRAEVVGYHVDAIIAPGSREMLSQIPTGEPGACCPGSPCAYRPASGRRFLPR